ncbi:hypothetical protein GGI26_002441 [Coemansia sp. RSA 1358]|nr:hypothetical protein GGI26_002441 [Coemansia sp. RSA 1358]
MTIPPIYFTSSQGLDNIILPQNTSLYQEWNANLDRLDASPRNRLQRQPEYSHATKAVQPNPAQIPHGRPWWMRLFVDSMLIPFVQGFMLNLGVHWIRSWRRSGGLLGVFRRRFSNNK